ncbi:MAG: adenylosuccinate synthetase [Nanoarchaeota archaeon]|nr:adenylosuccinate synthetase [Nanoarchaeota archaeon]
MKPGKSSILIGLQYGDEGKVKVLDKLLDNTDITARFNGGANAGHTLKVGDKTIINHQIPSGIFYDDMLLYIGSGCVVNPKIANGEISHIKDNGINIEKRLFVAANTPLVQPHHLILDGIHGKDIGTTNNGIGPAYADIAMRAHGNNLRNLQFGTYINNPKKGVEIVRNNLAEIIATYHLKDLNVRGLARRFDEEVNKLGSYCCKDPLFLEKLVQNGKNVFFEGANSVMLDAVCGIVPYVTSSRTLAGSAYVGGDLSLRYHDKTIGVAKAIMSRVGNGPFISEFGGRASEAYCAEGEGYAHKKEWESMMYNPDELLRSNDPMNIGIALRMIGGEYGATTKRPRRIGMLDLVMLKQNCMLNAVDELYINKIDCLSDFSKTTLEGIPLVTAYELDGKTIDYISTSIEECRRAKPVIEYMPAFSDDISGIREYNNLPPAAQSLIKKIEENIETKIAGIGVGPEREQFVKI